MNAIQFIKEKGVEKAREVVATYHGIPSYTFKEKTERGYSSCKSVDLDDLKRLVESVYLVKEHHTLDRAIEYANSQYTAPEIKVCLLDAIADYKAIYSDNNMGDDSHIENHISPLCKVEVK